MLVGGVGLVTILKRILQRRILKGTNLLDFMSVGHILEVSHECVEDLLAAK
jgi:hypothetical protein